MSWQTIAKKDFKDSVRSRVLWGIIGSFILLIFGLAYLATDGNIDSTAGFIAVIGGAFLFGIMLFVPLTGLFISIKSIVRERESGTINLLLSMPHSRRDMVLGKFVGRSAVMSISIVAGFLPASLLILLRAEVSPIFELFAFLLATVLLGLLFVGIGVGFSALVKSETQATVGGVLLFFLLYLWPAIFGILDIDLPPFLDRFYLLNLFFDMLAAIYSLNNNIPNASVVELGNTNFAEASATSAPIHMQHWFAFVILGAMIAIPLAVGYIRFNSTDI